MRVEVFTLVMQFAILALMGWTCWSLWRTHKRLQESTLMIEQYQREIGWLTTRIDLLERRAQTAPAQSPRMTRG